MASRLKLHQNLLLTERSQTQQGCYGQPKRYGLGLLGLPALPCPTLLIQTVAIWLAFSAAGFAHFSIITQPHVQSLNVALAWE